MSLSLTRKQLDHTFQNVITLSNAVCCEYDIFCIKLIQYNLCLVSTVDTDGLVL